MLSSPLTVPSQFKVAQASLSAMSVSGLNVSPFTGEEQIYVHQGEWWEWVLTCPPLSRANAEEVVAWLIACNGREHSFLLSPPGYGSGARGSLSGTPLVNGASQTGKVLATDGWTASASNVLKAGDWIQLGSGTTARLHKVVQAASADGAGQANLEIWPRLRESPADNDAVTVASPQGLFRLAEARRDYTIEQALIYGITVSVREAI